jgi:hypothetical protein
LHESDARNFTITPYGLKLKVPNNYSVSYVTGTLYINDDRGQNCNLTLSCVKSLTNDPSGYPYMATFSYSNPNSTAVYVPMGANNSLSSAGKYSGQQPQLFPTGSGSFTIYFDGKALTWSLIAYTGNNKVVITASSASKKCSGSQTGVNSNGSVAGESTAEQGGGGEPTAETDPVATVYPNPTRDLVTINIKNGIVSGNNFALIDSYGKVYQITGKMLSAHSIQLDLSRVSSGVYFIRLKVNNDFQIFKVVKI